MNIYWPKPNEVKTYVELDHIELQRKAAAFPRTALTTMEVPTYIGDFTICASAFGVSTLFFPGTDDLDVFSRFDYYGLAAASWGQKMAFEAGLELMGYTLGEVTTFETPVDLSYLTPFQQDILLSVRRVPFGETVTTRDIAHAAGHPGKGGAAAKVLRHNPLPILVPCHRVVAADGRIGGYCGPLESKQFLLDHEGVEIALATA